MLNDSMHHVEAMRAALTSRLGRTPLSLEPVAGGTCNEAWRVTFANGHHFCKRQSAPKFPQLLSRESAGLKLIAEAQLIRTPNIIDQWETDSDQFLLLEWIGETEPTPAYWERLGRQLAALHRVAGDVFGAVPDNYMGLVPQRNQVHRHWTDFFLAERLYPVALLCRQHNRVDDEFADRLEALTRRFDALFPDARPCLVHGDLWRGNVLCANDEPVLIDPAAYWGERSVDLAMTDLFGGFPKRFYDAYDEAYPLPPQHRAQWDLVNLYPLLIHLYLFGDSYYPAIEQTLRRYA